LEANVHFPSDISLLWDSARKSLDIITELRETYPINGWRKIKFWYKDLKKQCRILSKACQSGGKGKEHQVKKQAKEYLRIANELNEKIIQSKEQFYKLVNSPMSLAQLLSLDYYHNMFCKHIDLVERRLIKGEVIPQSEKLYSIFETHTEWKKKGKSNNKVELGHNVLIASDQFQFIVYHKVIDHQQDVELVIPLADSLQMLFGENAFSSISLDKGFWRLENKLLLQMYFPNVIMPKKGKKNKEEQEEEKSKVFKKLRNKHSAVESNINSLEHHGLNRCPDRGKKGFAKYAALGVLSYNLHRLGLIVMSKQEEKIPPIRKAA
jgi:IS5 family transposase